MLMLIAKRERTGFNCGSGWTFLNVTMKNSFPTFANHSRRHHYHENIFKMMPLCTYSFGGSFFPPLVCICVTVLHFVFLIISL